MVKLVLTSTACVLACVVGCKPSAPDHLNIVDFRPYSTNRHWRPADLFSDAQVIALAEAVKKNDLPEIDRLAKSGVDLNAIGKDGVTPLGRALMVKNKTAYQRLLELGADPNRLMCRVLPILELVAKDESDSQWLDLALRHGGNPNVENGIVDCIPGMGCLSGKETPIFSAIASSNKRSVDLLIAAGANLNHQNLAGRTPLTNAALSRDFDFVQYLLDAGADFTIKDNDGRDLANYLMTAYVQVEDRWAAREKVIGCLEAKGVDFESESKKITDPTLRDRWDQRMKWLAEKKITAP